LNQQLKNLPIVWQRLVDTNGETCPRCGGTLDELRKAVGTLEQSLRLLGIKPSLETREIDHESFQQDPSQSNRIWIAGKPIEEWLGAEASSSACCSVCGDAECRTVEVDSESFEVIPSELILRAALLAASQMLRQEDLPENAACGPGCCSGER